jgi:hypothetical protein
MEIGPNINNIGRGQLQKFTHFWEMDGQQIIFCRNLVDKTQ